MLATELITRLEAGGSIAWQQLDNRRKPRLATAVDGPSELPLPIPACFIADILKPYRTEARYLRAARLEEVRGAGSAVSARKGTPLIRATGRFSIPHSCYIDDTGHFNAVEFNICFNQLAYVVFGKCIEDGIIKKLRLDSGCVGFGDFKRGQLSSMLIVKIESRYYRPMISGDFCADFRLERISASAGAFFCFTSIDFSDAEGVKSKGTFLLAYNPTAVTRPPQASSSCPVGPDGEQAKLKRMLLQNHSWDDVRILMAPLSIDCHFAGEKHLR